jgi:hypothetical protein
MRRKPKATHPLVSHRTSVAFPFKISAVCWFDLLGYGSMIAEADFIPLHPKATAAIARLRKFHEIVAKHSGRYFPTLVMNDGAAAYRDLSLRNRSVTHDFLVRAWDLYREINQTESDYGFPGARAVLACGFRMRGRRGGLDATSSQFTSLMRRFQAGELSASQAIREAANIRQHFDVAPRLQANFAFTIAYLADASGSAGGLSGSRFFTDLILFDSPQLDWIKLEQPIRWAHERFGLRADFASLIDIPEFKHPPGGPLGICDGLEIATKLTGDTNVLEALRTARKAENS